MNGVYQGRRTGRTERKIRRFFACMMAVLMIIIGPMGAWDASAAGDISISIESGSSGQQGDDVNTVVKVTNNTGGELTFTNAILDFSAGGVSSKYGAAETKVTIGKGSSANLNFEVHIKKTADETEHNVTLTLYNGSTVQASGTASYAFSVSEKSSVPGNGYTGGYTASFDMDCKTNHGEGLIAGSDNIFTVELFNRGNTYLKNTEVKLNLPEGITVFNASNTVNAGYITVGSRYTAKFPLKVDGDMESKTYGIEVEVTGADVKNNSQTIKKTYYIQVEAGSSTSSLDNVDITNISIPNQAPAGEDFLLTFGVTNRGTTDVNDVTVSVEMPEGVINKTKNNLVIKKLEKNATKTQSITLSTPTDAEEKYHSFKITVSAGKGDKAASVQQYAGILVKKVAGKTKTPQLMISDYGFGGNYVQAGDEFPLRLSLFNTNKTVDMQNIKVSLTSEAGGFMPVGGSGSFFIEAINHKETAEYTLWMTTKHDVEQKTIPLSVKMTYEDLSGNEFTAEDSIAIPVVQETRLVVDDITAPSELYAGMQTGTSIKFYNMGKTTLNNLRVDVQGEFDAPESNMYYVGNMEAGKSDSFDFSFIPRAEGLMPGIITFTYEDASGKEWSYEKQFEFNVMAEMPMDEGDMGELPEEPKKTPWVPIGIGAAVVVLVAGLVWRKKHLKKKLDREMEMDE